MTDGYVNMERQRGDEMLQVQGFTTPPEEHWKNCPYCMNPLGKMEIWKRKKRKIVVCKKCKRTIDERHILW